MNLDNSSQLIMSSMNTSRGQVRGINNAVVENGVATLDAVSFIATPGSSSVGFEISSKILDKEKLLAIFNKTLTSKQCFANFRYCQSGERQIGKQCETCSAGTFSLKWNSTECHKCVNNAVCRGGAELVVNKGYWRRTANSSTIVRCLNEEV